MAIYHLSVKTFSRSKGQSATAAVAYRAAAKIHCDHERRDHDYSKKRDVIHSEIFLPPNAPSWANDRQQLWNEVERAEKRKNSTVAREFEVALPNELNKEQRIALVQDFAKQIVARHGCAVDAHLHDDKGSYKSKENQHAHIMLTTRRLEPEGFTKKTRELDEKKSGEVVYWREQWAKVEAVGPDVTEFVVGDTVSVVPAFSFADYGLYGELVNAPAHAVVKHPENLSFIEAAATWMMFVTAYGALIEFGKLEAGETVLIGAASSSVGLAAIQIANMVGATPIALTRSSKKRQALLDAGAVHVIATQEQDLISEVMALTDGKGARMAFDPVGGPDAGKILQTLSMQGIFFQYGALDTRDIPVPVMDILSKHLTLRGYELFEITGDLDKLEQAKNFINQGLANGELRPIINRTFTFEEMAEAHSYMESNTQVGKIVVTL
ncbi:MobQ family relaxase [Psychrobacter pacificensis]|uniref:MobQ family relaxase n=1 Tax=Psychrobacter pacificensis TaxID=112002 RepID=UPI003D036F97